MSALAWVMAVAACGVAGLLQLRLREVALRCARAGHEVRGGLCAALLGVERLATDVVDAGTVRAVELELRRAAVALDELAGRGRAADEVVDVADLVAAASAGWSALAGIHDARLEVEVTPGQGLVVHGDRVRLAQACGNLVANAVEHGGGVVRVRARALAGAVRVEVTDGGPGLPAPVGTLVASARRRRGRRGHGLAVAAQVAARHGGRLAAGPSSAGARVVLELPAAVPP